MEIREALEKLRGYLKDIERLKTLRYDNQERSLWKNRVNVVVEAAFGRDSTEYRALNPLIAFIGWAGMTEADKQKQYLGDLQDYELGIKKVLDKYEILGTPIPSEAVPLGEPAEVPKAFIAHGGVHFVLNKLKNFLSALGVEPLVVEEQPSKGMTVDDKVEFYLSQADCAIVLATADDEIDGKLHPRQNVVHEIGLAQKALRGKLIYLLEQYAEFPSNVSPKVWERFDRTNMESAFIRVAKELKAFGIIRAARSVE